MRFIVLASLALAACSPPVSDLDSGSRDVANPDVATDAAMDGTRPADASDESLATDTSLDDVLRADGTSPDVEGDISRDAGAAVSGEPMPVGDIPGWHQIFTDDFETNVPLGSFPAAVSTRWGAYDDGWMDTSRNGRYMPSRVLSVANGTLDMHIHTEGGVHMVSAPYPRLPGATASNGLSAGRYVARFRADRLPLYKTAWLLWPDSETWPRDGEIDFPEGDLDGTMSAFVHHQGGTSGGDQDAFPTSMTYGPWHTAIIEWTPGMCRFLLDGAVIGTSTTRVPNTPMHWVLQTETALSGSAPDDTTDGHVLVDWVAVYVPAP